MYKPGTRIGNQPPWRETCAYWRCGYGTEGMRRLCGWSARGNLPGGRWRDEATVLRLRPGTVGDQNAGTNARRRWGDDQVAKRTGVGRSVDVVMPDRSEGRPEQQHEQCYRDQYAPRSFRVRHFLRPNSRRANTVRISVVQDPHC